MRRRPTLSDTGTIAFNDVDLIDVHTAPAWWRRPANTLGRHRSRSACGQRAAPAPSAGTVGLDLPVANSATQYLAVGQTATETFTVTISDGTAAPSTQLVTVTVTGTNDAPTITAALTDAAARSPRTRPTPTLSDTGTIAFNDVDLIDVHTAPAWWRPARNTLGRHPHARRGRARAAGHRAPARSAWTYTVANSATQYLAVGQTATETFTVTISDGNGGTVDAAGHRHRHRHQRCTDHQASTDAAGAVTEDVRRRPTLTDSGTIAFNDVDLTDVPQRPASRPTRRNTLGGIAHAAGVTRERPPAPATAP